MSSPQESESQFNQYGSFSDSTRPPTRPRNRRYDSSNVSFLEIPSSLGSDKLKNRQTDERASLVPSSSRDSRPISKHGSLLPCSYYTAVDQELEPDSADDLNRHLNASPSNHRLSQGRFMGSLKMSDWMPAHTPSAPSTPHPGHSRRASYLSGNSVLTETERRSKPRRWKKKYDDEFQEELVRQSGNGIRVWYESYCTIDWLHELIKESIRRKKLAQLDGWLGTLSRTWDKSQAWVLVTLVGICTALVADQIVSTEMWLFELKEGYCANGWRTPKRFCCDSPNSYTSSSTLGSMSRFVSVFDRSNLFPFLSPTSPQPSQSALDHSFDFNATRRNYRSPAFSSGSFISQWSFKSPSPLESPSQSCPDWHPWTDLLSPHSSQPIWIEYLVYMFFSLFFAGLSSLLTVYLSRSTQIHTSTYPQSDHNDSSSTVHNNLNDPSPGIDANCSSYFDTLPTNPKPPSTQSSSNRVPPKISYFAAGSGIPEVKCILSGFVIRGYLGLSTMLTKAVGLSLSVGSGLTLGKEGPLVHIACCIGNIFTRLFPKFDRNEGKRREMLSAACAAGVSVAFGAPIGGVLFSLEEVSYFFPPRVMWRSCWCAIVAAATLRVLDPFKTGKTVLFEVTYDQQWHFIELSGFILLGLVTGVLGAWLAKLNVWWTKTFRKQPYIDRHPVLEVLLVAFVTCLLAFSNRFMKLAGTELVYEMLAECQLSDASDPTSSSISGACISDPKDTAQLILNIGIAVLLKFLITAVTFGIKCPAGIFVPSLCIGAMLGRILGYLVEYAYYSHPDLSVFQICDASRPFGQACIVPGVWAMVGAAAMLAGVTRTTLSLAVIVVELTGSLVYILPISISVIVAKTTADAIEHRSIYDLVMDLSELPYLDAKSEYLHYAKPEDIMDRNAEVIVLNGELRASDLRQSIKNMLEAQQLGSGFPLIETSDNGDRRISGYVGLVELEHSLSTIEGDPICTFDGADPDAFLNGDSSSSDEPTVDFGYLVDHAPVTVSIQTPMELIHEIFVRLGVRYLVVQNHNGAYLGIIEKNRWLRYLSWNEQHDSKHKTD
ncbi:hypothetical protein PTTG_26215 [Puccinia triticina 1-1 BBBD Race 1]|uniref:Chloride channel protein n=1 Tax=Puccinia triticina (isolate 1-1 / race 1 (BBBD)) TaxID=630390 RepID=A0A180GW00_PUCT1|nr:hypothetical protein PTTG_26215 [Puccinia triticina 1-1 BBBD Race 1]WAR55512.1 hypothetical protein PtB15_6B253 [Puccinia triticina]